MIPARKLAITGITLLVGVWSGAVAQSPPLSLQDALAALPASPDWLTAELTYQGASLSLESARANAGLRVTAGGNYSLSKDLASSAAPNQSASISANLATTVLPWGSALDDVASAERALARAALDRQDTRNNLAISLVSEYYAARLAASDLALANANRDLAEAQYAVVAAQRANGAATEEALLNAGRARDNARANADNAARALEIARLTLGGSLGKDLGAADLGTAVSVPAMPSGQLPDLIAAAVQARSDVKKAELNVQSAQVALANAQRDRYFPDSTVNAQYSAAGGPSLSTNLNLKTGSLGASVSYQVLGGSGTTQAGNTVGLSASVSLPIIAPASDIRITSAQASLSSAQAALDATKRAAELDVRQKYSDASAALAKATIAQSSVTSAENSLAAAQARLAGGTATRLDVQSAQVGLQQAQRDLQSANVNAALAVYRLQNAVGTLKLVPQEAQS